MGALRADGIEVTIGTYHMPGFQQIVHSVRFAE